MLTSEVSPGDRTKIIFSSGFSEKKTAFNNTLLLGFKYECVFAGGDRPVFGLLLGKLFILIVGYVGY
jgi:hypothetical protein